MKIPKSIFLFLFFFFELISCHQNYTIWDDQFKNNKSHWDLYQDVYQSITIENGNLHLKNNIDNVYTISLIKNPNPKEFFKITSNIKINNIDDGGVAGLILFADNNKNPKTFVFFGVNDKKELMVTVEDLIQKKSYTYCSKKVQNFDYKNFNCFEVVQDKDILHFELNKKTLIKIKPTIKLGENFGYFCQKSDFISKQIKISGKK